MFYFALNKTPVNFVRIVLIDILEVYGMCLTVCHWIIMCFTSCIISDVTLFVFVYISNVFFLCYLFM